MLLGTTGVSGRVVENIFIYVAVISVSLLALITFLMIYFVVRYHRKRNPNPEDIRGSLWLEIAWTVFPTLLVLTMFFYGLTGFESLKKIPEGAMKVKVISRMWSWGFEYEKGVHSEILKVPVGKDIELLLTTLDVIHSFYIPAFKIKQDAVPGMENRLWFKPTEVGTYDVLCAEYCGLRHSYMLTKLEVLPEEEFKKWYEIALGKATAEKKAMPRGAQLLQEKGCRACHTVDGAPLLGPTFKGLFRKNVTVLTEGKERTLLADENYIRNSIVEPGKDLVKGFPPVMPPTKLTEDEINQIIGYLKELK
jgi:cytochrome c oxidase subunit II